MSTVRYARIYIREVKSGDLAMGHRDVFVVDEEAVYPVVLSLATMSLSLVMAEDYESVRDLELTSQQAQRVLDTISERKPKSPTPELEDALIRIAAFARKHLVTGTSEARVRTRTRSVAEQPTAEAATPRVRVRERVAQTPTPTPVVRTRVRSR